MAPPRVVLNRSVGASMFFIFLMYGGMMNAVYYIAIWFQAAQGQSAKEAGIRTIPMVLALVLCGIVAAGITQRIGYYVPALLISPVLASVGAGLLSTLVPTSGPRIWIGYQIIYGLGLGAGAQTSTLASQTVLATIRRCPWDSDKSLGAATWRFHLPCSWPEYLFPRAD